jgi:hypothetical protein
MPAFESVKIIRSLARLWCRLRCPWWCQSRTRLPTLMQNPQAEPSGRPPSAIRGAPTVPSNVAVSTVSPSVVPSEVPSALPSDVPPLLAEPVSSEAPTEVPSGCLLCPQVLFHPRCPLQFLPTFHACWPNLCRPRHLLCPQVECQPCPQVLFHPRCPLQFLPTCHSCLPNLCYIRHLLRILPRNPPECLSRPQPRHRARHRQPQP